MKEIEEVGPDPELAACLREIESRVERGSSYHWTTDDFTWVSNAIREKTGTVLSVTTLKRLWGKVKYNSSPSLHTLNTLSLFLGYPDWRGYQKSLRGMEEVPPWEKTHRPPMESPPIPWVLILALLGVGLLAALIPRPKNTPAESIRTKDFRFSSRPVAEGIPNSVIFTYDARAAGPEARVEIQQNWDDRRRQTVSHQDSVASSIYYQPGYYEAKLLVDGEVVRENDILIPSNGWLGIVDHEDDIPIYFSESELTKGDYLSLGPELLRDSGVDPGASDQWVSLQMVKDFGALNITDFSLETTLKSEFGEGAARCRAAEITLLFSGEVIIIPLSIPGCVADLRLWVLDQAYEGRNTDLSAFGVQMDQDVRLRVKTMGEELFIYLDEVLVRRAVLPEGRTNNFSGVRYRFRGGGSIKDIRIGTTTENVWTSESP